MKLIVAMLLSSVLLAQQPNTQAATLLSTPAPVAGAGPPMVVFVPFGGGSVDLEVVGAPFAPYLIAAMPGPPTAGLYATCNGVLDIDPFLSVVVASGVLDWTGYALSRWPVDAATPISVTVQAAVVTECECSSVAIYFWR